MENSTYKSVIKKFDDFGPHELYEMLALRQEVFVVEQDCVYQDLDGRDALAIHFLIFRPGSNKIVAYARAFPPDQSGDSKAVIGRVIVKQGFRKLGLGNRIMLESIDFCHQQYPGHDIRISAQTYLENFYTALGFKDTGNHYLEDGIPHMEMVLESQ